tara:strand:- start:3945 stop:4274 length:330 start_codon:yes stop_codon:yes gene_type:complete
MSIPTIGNSASATDGRSTVKQSGNQPAAGAGTGNQKADSRGGAAGTSGADAVSISNRATDLQALESSIRDLPEVNSARVTELRDKINAGEYQIDSRRLADKILAFEKNL